MMRQWTEDEILETTGAFQPACVIMAGAELGVFDALADGSMTAERLATRLNVDCRATTMLADALASLEMLSKEDDQYANAPGIREALAESGERSILAMVRHRANCLRGWAQLAQVVQTGLPADRPPSIRGPEGDLEAFIEAMNDIHRSTAPKLVEALGPRPFRHLLDVGGGPGTWTMAFLRASAGATATLFDRPDVIPIARKHISAARLLDRVSLVGGDFNTDEVLPSGADLAWISAIVHMNSREENRALFRKTYAALVAGGQILIRDVVMEESRTAPIKGALFAINMLVNVPAGGTFTFRELSEDLLAAGFQDPLLVHTGEYMDSVIRAVKATG